MAATASPTAAAPAHADCPRTIAQATPTNADTTLPITIDQGCASGLDGTANTSTAAAPKGAINQAPKLATPASQCVSKAATKMPTPAPTTARTRSVKFT